MQITNLFPTFDELHRIHGSSSFKPVYGAGQIDQPKVCLIFMNPTAKNVSSHSRWEGIQAPWLGTKNIWKLLYRLGLFKNTEILRRIELMRPEEWDPEFALKLYEEITIYNQYCQMYPR